MIPHREYECPACGEWIEILLTTQTEHFPCPWCNEPLRLSEDGEFRDGHWRDLSKLLSQREHIERMIKFKPAPDEMRDAYINDYDGGMPDDTAA